MSYPTTDLGLTSYIIMKGYKIIEIKFVTNTVMRFIIDCDIEEGNKFQDDFIESEYRNYYNAIQQVKYIMRNYRDRKTLDSDL